MTAGLFSSDVRTVHLTETSILQNLLVGLSIHFNGCAYTASCLSQPGIMSYNMRPRRTDTGFKPIVLH